MTATKRASPRSLGSDLDRVAARVIQPEEYEELPELTGEMLARGKVNKGGRPRLPTCTAHSTPYAGVHSMSVTPFVPADFEVPATLETDEFRLRMLTVNDVVKDYDAVITSVDHLRTIWPGGKWPEGLTLEQNLIDLGWHQKEFQTRRSFAYTVVTRSESRVLGCVYIEPTQRRGYDAVVYLWARQSELASGLESRLHAAVREWVKSTWPFESAGFPGRGVAWDAWRATPNEPR